MYSKMAQVFCGHKTKETNSRQIQLMLKIGMLVTITAQKRKI